MPNDSTARPSEAVASLFSSIWTQAVHHLTALYLQYSNYVWPHKEGRGQNTNCLHRSLSSEMININTDRMTPIGKNRLQTPFMPLSLKSWHSNATDLEVHTYHRIMRLNHTHLPNICFGSSCQQKPVLLQVDWHRCAGTYAGDCRLKERNQR